MDWRRAAIGMLAVVLLSMAGPVVVAHAQEINGNSSGVPLPVIPMGSGESCVKDTDYMRRNHMDMLKHQRDETVLEGIRSEQYSLTECLDCHAVTGADAVPVTVSSPQHFCRSCHDYAAVSIDCFQCHASRPESAAMGDAHDG